MRFNSLIGLQTRVIFLFTLSFSEVGLAQSEEIDPPQNPFLADSAWPMSHRNPYNQGSSPLAGPNSNAPKNVQLVSYEPISITVNIGLLNSDQTATMWVNTLKRVANIHYEKSKLTSVSSIDSKQSIDHAISGAYTVLDLDSNLYVPRSQFLEVYTNKSIDGAMGSIKRKMTKKILDDSEDFIVGINMTYDGNIVYITHKAQLGIVSRDLNSHHSLRINSNEQVSNSLALDENGGIYAVTDKKVYRFNWNGIDLNKAWEVPYQSSDEQASGRLGKGSGTTPTLMGVGDQDSFVVIADGQKLMNLVLIWRNEIPESWVGIANKDRRIAAEVPITFGNNLASTSTTEQSVLVRGYGAVVVNNDYGKILPGPFPNISDLLTILLSNRRRVAPYGIEKFVWNSESKELERSWANSKVSCPNGIPTMSGESRLMYCLGQRNQKWSLEALNWDNGEWVFSKVLGGQHKYNSFYAALEIGPFGDLISSVLGGVLRITDQD